MSPNISYMISLLPCLNMILALILYPIFQKSLEMGKCFPHYLWSLKISRPEDVLNAPLTDDAVSHRNNYSIYVMLLILLDHVFITHIYLK